ncbi:MAG: ATP-binding protein [Hyphomonadaceae bacterium]|nr:ATP-binding protein [Hyphomonadaceae bacterium]
MPLTPDIKIAHRFLRSVRIDSDLDNESSLDGFICPQSSANMLLSMARHASNAGQGAFTWTGPYGSGKSSLVVALAALLNGNGTLKEKASKVFGAKVANDVWEALPTGTGGWRILPVVARRDAPVSVIGEALVESKFTETPAKGWTESALLESLASISREKPKTHGGLIIFIDEMGKFLEAAAQDGDDIYILQQLAEAASRSERRLIVVGILHQSFEEYANRISREVREEWSKIQGRFVDLVVNTADEEQIDLISRAIEGDHKSFPASKPARVVAKIARRNRADGIEAFSKLLEGCWPLHPVVACLLGPISRQRFGQNQRSIFGFLNSSELFGFQDFLKDATKKDFYLPKQLWDYMRANLEASILASPDGHRWALATEAVERCEALTEIALDIDVLKTVAIIDLFKERAGLVANIELLKACFPDVSADVLNRALQRLSAGSFVIFRKFQDAYAIYAGSDFDIERAVQAALKTQDQIDFKALQSLAGLQPIFAKRHYHATGNLRWFDVGILPVSELMDVAGRFDTSKGALGRFLLAVPTQNETKAKASKVCRDAARLSHDTDIVVGLSGRSWAIVPLAKELAAIEKVADENPELAGDAVARREVEARRIHLQVMLESEIQKAFDSSSWFGKNFSERKCRQAELNSIASELADRRFRNSPRLHNELINRQKPSGSAVAAQKALMRRMVLEAGKPRLGIEKFPPEGGLLASLLERTGLYAQDGDDWRFVRPGESQDDVANLVPLWDAAMTYIQDNDHRTVDVSEIYELWRKPPFGVREGVMPLLIMALIVTEKNSLAVYRQNIFRARFDDVDVDYLAKDPSVVQLRWVDISEASRDLLSGMAEIVRRHGDNELSDLEPIDVARGLIAIYDNLPKWTKRTMRLSANATQIRDTLKRAHDPNALLFDDLPGAFGSGGKTELIENLNDYLESFHDGMNELVKAYPAMLAELRDLTLAELQVPNLLKQSISELHERAASAVQLAGDFKIDAFVGRLSLFDGSEETFEQIASLVVSKPPRDWVDLDLDRAAIELADMSQKFMRAETFARVKDRPQKRQSIAVVIGMNGAPEPALQEFQVGSADRSEIEQVIESLELALDKSNPARPNIMLAALAEMSLRYMESGHKTSESETARVSAS